MPAGARAITRLQISQFMASLARYPSVDLACSTAGFSTRQAYRLREVDADFCQEWSEAISKSAESLEIELFRRARDGVKRPLVSMGKIMFNPDGSIMEVTEYSDKLLELALKGARPEKYARPDAAAAAARPQDLQPDPVPTPDEPGPAKPIL